MRAGKDFPKGVHSWLLHVIPKLISALRANGEMSANWVKINFVTICNINLSVN
jgi:hypothetical protein